MKVNNVSLERVVGRIDQLPTNELVEIAFAGRSNVGKSSLINTLISRKALARTSGQPGKTQTINFYNVEDKVYFVDLPGYGYAKVSKKERDRWGNFIETYIKSSKQLKLILLLVDIRHKPSEQDKMMYNWILYLGYTPLVVATKMDKLKRSQIQKHIKILKEELNATKDTVFIPFSSHTKQGKEELWGQIDAHIEVSL
ncbi:GTP-binding protein [Natranaerovirga hydrolytica]|uniref:Probable GTP-binding protein EngB n=1 Tax=Natranaerovirga hydrolytica TaxID=680378 RepID=A0A4R1MEG1_9FIRM|nr:ribosome biogenesis GTP-binding protein YihA/YsxC [Natranaerovirga hydrolytica]TCK90605.1 GTP-binding protein [Natranaerovirga hydrolytica]